MVWTQRVQLFKKKKVAKQFVFVEVKKSMRKADIAFVAIMLTIQLPFLGSLWFLVGYIITNKIFRNIKDHLLTMTIPTV